MLSRFYVIAFLLSTSPLLSQIQQLNRYELSLGNTEGGFEIIPAAEKGLFLSRYMLGNPVDVLEFVHLDTSFHEKWKGYVAIEDKLLLVGKKAENNFIYFIFRHADVTKNDLILYAFNQDNGNYIRYSIKSFIRFSPTEFQVSKEAIILGGYFNRIPLVLHFSFLTQKSKILPGLFNEEGELTQVQVHPDGTFDILISSKNMRREKTIWIKNYSPDGTLIGNYALSPEGNKNLLFGRSVKTSRNMQVVAGVYGLKNSEYSRGLFVATIDPSGIQQLKYYNFADLENFFKYMKAKREYRIKERIHRKKVKGKKIRFNYRFLVHEVIEHKGQFILLGEAFYPRYISPERYYGGFFRGYAPAGNRLVKDGLIFDGFYYTHAVVMGFDKDGKLLWDNSFEINDVKTFTLEQFVKLEILDNKIALIYLFDNQIRSKIIQDNRVIEGKSTNPIKTSHESDIPLKDNAGVNKLGYWYDNYFYAFGTQSIVNPQNQAIPKRRVFFINKISYR